MDKLNLIDIFLTVSRSGSFTGAASQLGVDPSTVSKAIGQLESHLGLRLFNRTTRQLQLTDSGEIYRQACRDLLLGLTSCEEKLRSDHSEPKGVLKVNLPVAYGQLYIMPMLNRFYEAYPNIKLDVSLTDDYVDMIDGSIDVAIRSGRLKDSRLVAKKLSPMDFAICASPALLSKYKRITAANIQKVPWVLYRFVHNGQLMPITAVKGRGNKKEFYEFSPEPALITTDGLSLVTACKAGIGFIQAPHFLLREAVENREVELVQSYYRDEKYNVYAYYSYKTNIPKKVRVFIDFIVDELAAINESHCQTFLSSI